MKLPWEIKCIGTFKPIEGANPYIGEKDKLEFVQEEKLEVRCSIEKDGMLSKITLGIPSLIIKGTLKLRLTIFRPT